CCPVGGPTVREGVVGGPTVREGAAGTSEVRPPSRSGLPPDCSSELVYEWVARRATGGNVTPSVGVDVGNTRIKWGVVGASGGVGRVASLPDDPAAWQAQLDEWIEAGLLPAGPSLWAMASVQPARCERLKRWLESGGRRAVQITRAAELPLKVGL